MYQRNITHEHYENLNNNNLCKIKIIEITNDWTANNITYFNFKLVPSFLAKGTGFERSLLNSLHIYFKIFFMQTNSEMRKILIVAPSWIGDMIMAQSLLKIIKQLQPDTQIHILAPAHLELLIKRMPEVDEVLISPFGHGDFKLHNRYVFGCNLKAQNYEQCIVLPNSWKSALIPFFAQIPLRTGWRGEMRYGLINDLRILDGAKLPLMVQRFAALAFKDQKNIPDKIPLPRLVTSEATINATLQRLNFEKPQKRILGFCVGAEYGSAKRWPEKYFAEIAKAKYAEGWDIWIFGGPKDKAIAEEVQKISGNICIDLTGKTNLAEATDLISLAEIVITNDTGLMHLAAALDVQIIAIYGSSSPQFTPPLSNKAKILSLNLPCSPCFARECKLIHFKCMQKLKPTMVLEALHELE